MVDAPLAMKNYKTTIVALVLLALLAAYVLLIDEPPKEELPETLFTVLKDSIVALELERADGKLSFEKEPSGGWYIRSHSSLRASTESVGEMLRSVAMMEIERELDYPAGELTGLGTSPVSSIRFFLRSITGLGIGTAESSACV